jgi:hypothetical protein
MTQRSIRDSARARKPAAAEPAEFAPSEELEEPEAAPAEPPEAEDEVVWELGGIAKPPPSAAAAPAAPRQPPVPLKDRLRRIPPGVAVLTVAAVLSLGFLLFEIGSRTASVQLLTSAGLVCGIVYVAVTVACFSATVRLGVAGRLWPALAVAFVGGSAAFVAAGAFAGALLLFLALGF